MGVRGNKIANHQQYTAFLLESGGAFSLFLFSLCILEAAALKKVPHEKDPGKHILGTLYLMLAGIISTFNFLPTSWAAHLNLGSHSWNLVWIPDIKLDAKQFHLTYVHLCFNASIFHLSNLASDNMHLEGIQQ